MDSDKYVEGQSMQRSPLFESDSFVYWKNRFETYVKSKDLDLWHVIINGDFQPIEQNPKTKLDEVIPFERKSDDLKNRLAKNYEAEMKIYNALPRKEYEKNLMCNTAKEIWKTLLITHQCNSQVKDNKIDLLVQQYEQFVISEDESIDSAFARFNTIITCLKALDEGYSSKNYVRKFLRALHPKWIANVTTIKESKDLTSLFLDELIGNLKVHDMIIKTDSKIVKAKVERKSLTLKSKKESSNEECSTSGSEDEEYAMALRDFKKFFKRRDRKCFRCGDPNHLIGECPKPPKEKNQRAFVRGSWSDSGEEDDEKVNNETCLVAQASSEVCSESSYCSDENLSIDDLVQDNDKLCKMSLNIITKNKRLKATRNNLEKELSVLKEKVSTLEKNKGVDIECLKCHMLKIVNKKLKDEVTRLNKFEKSTQCLNEMLSNQKPSGEKLGLGFSSFEASSSGTKEIKFVKAQKKASSDGGPINISDPHIVQAAPKIIIGPPAVMPGSEKSVSFQKSILGPRLKHIIVNNVKVPIASDNEVKQFYKPLSKPEVGFSKPNFRSKTPPPRSVINNYPRPKTPQLKRNVGRQNQPRSFPICLGVDLEPDEWIKDSGCSKHMTGNRKLFSSYKAYNGGNVFFGSYLRGNIIGKGRGIRKKGLYVMKLGNKPKDQICLATIDENSTLWHRRLGHANMRLIQSLASKELVRNLPKLKFDQHFCDACKIGKQAHASHKAKNIVSTTRCLELLHMDLFGPSAVRSYGGNRYTLVIVDDYSRYTWTRFLKDKTEAFDQFEIFKPKNVNEALTDESWIIDMQEELNQFITNDVWELVPQPKNMKIIGTKCVFRNKLDENVVVSRNKARLESIRILLDYACALDLKLLQMDVKSAFLNGFINEEKFGLEDSKPMKTSMSDTKLTKDEVCESIDSTKYQVMIGTMNLGLWYPKGTGIETVVYAISDHAGDYVDRKSTSGICTFVGCFLTSWFSKKQTALAISTTEAKYVTMPRISGLDHQNTRNYIPLISNEFEQPLQNTIALLEKRHFHEGRVDRVMHPLAPHYKRKTRSDHGKKRPRDSNASSYSTNLNHPSSFHPLDDIVDVNDEESFCSNSSFPSQNISSSSNVVS
ncbi:zf-CCHC domain-containing protein [Tanacetum coccineum]